MLREYGQRIFSLDQRAFGFLRVALGLTVVYVAVQRLFDFQAHYSSTGLLPLSLFTEAQRQTPFLFRLAFLSDADFFQQGLLLLLAALGLGLAFGFYARTMAVLCFVLNASFNWRAPILLHLGDELLAVTLFWFVFLPKDRRYAPGTVAYVYQISLIYLVSALHKIETGWLSENMVLRSLRHTQLQTPFAMKLIRHPELLQIATFTTVAWQLGFAVLILMPRMTRHRSLLVGLMIVFHLLTGLVLHLDFIGIIASAMLLPLLPASFWERLPKMSAQKEPSEPSATLLWAAVLLLMIFFSLQALFSFSPFYQWQEKQASSWTRWRPVPGVWQQWRMFAPPPRFFGAYQVSATLVTGQQVILRDTATEQREGQGLGGNLRWYKYFYNLPDAGFRNFRPGLANYYCRTQSAQVASVKLQYTYLPSTGEQVPARVDFLGEFPCH